MGRLRERLFHRIGQVDVKVDVEVDFELLHLSHFDQCLLQLPLAGGQRELLRDEFFSESQCMSMQVCTDDMCVPARVPERV